MRYCSFCKINFYNDDFWNDWPYVNENRFCRNNNKKKKQIHWMSLSSLSCPNKAGIYVLLMQPARVIEIIVQFVSWNVFTSIWVQLLKLHIVCKFHMQLFIVAYRKRSNTRESLILQRENSSNIQSTYPDCDHKVLYFYYKDLPSLLLLLQICD